VEEDEVEAFETVESTEQLEVEKTETEHQQPQED